MNHWREGAEMSFEKMMGLVGGIYENARIEGHAVIPNYD
jgi:hypothetical protein